MLSVALWVSGLVPLALVLALGGPTIRRLRGIGAGQRVRDDGPQRHLQKEGTPTMGGILIVAAAGLGALAGTLVLGRWLADGREFWRVGPLIAGGAVVAASAYIGWADDWRKIKRGRSLGLRARQKLALQFVASVCFVAALVWWRARGEGGFAGEELGWTQLLPWAAFWVVAMMATSNAVNLADGLDGLAAGICALSSAGFAVLALLSERHLVAVAALALTGACLGFLWFNRHPAKVFMGDVGSLALGTALAAMAALMDAPLALVGLCLVAFIEEFSVIIQVVSYQTRGVRVFKMSPIHHHFELCGWPERKVVLVFWAVQLLAAVVVVGWEAAGRAL